MSDDAGNSVKDDQPYEVPEFRGFIEFDQNHKGGTVVVVRAWVLWLLLAGTLVPLYFRFFG